MHARLRLCRPSDVKKFVLHGSLLSQSLEFGCVYTDLSEFVWHLPRQRVTSSQPRRLLLAATLHYSIDRGAAFLTTPSWQHGLRPLPPFLPPSASRAMNDILVHGNPAIRVSGASDGSLRTPSAPSARRSKPQKHVSFQPLVRIVQDTRNLVLSWRDGLSESEREDKARTEERMQILAARMHNVSRSRLLPRATSNTESSGNVHGGMGGCCEGARLPRGQR